MKFKELQKIFDTYRLYKDRGVVRMVAAAVIANQLVGSKRKPVWIVFVAPPGGGKSDVTGTVTGVQKYNDETKEVSNLCEEISDLTTASFASGMNSNSGETSMIKRMNKKGGMFLFKDFTTLLSKRHEDLAAIMSYLREIYDGKFEKKFGNGKVVSWEGKVGLIASCTTIIYYKLPELSVMGDRMMMYQVEQPDRMEVQQKIWENEDAGVDGSEEMSMAMRDYIHKVMDFIDKNKQEVDNTKIDEETRKEFFDVADFTSQARSGVVWNYKKDTIAFVPDPEMPTRVLRQLIAFANALMVMNMSENGNGILTENDKKLIYKLAFDSIPSQRREVLRTVGTYRVGATIEGIADKIGMPYDSVKIITDELVAIKVFDRSVDPVNKKVYFKIKPKLIDTVVRYEHITQVDEELSVETEKEDRSDFHI